LRLAEEKYHLAIFAVRHNAGLMAPSASDFYRTSLVCRNQSNLQGQSAEGKGKQHSAAPEAHDYQVHG
jgi:hypothetical protein